MSKLAIRAYTQRINKSKKKYNFNNNEHPLRHDRVLVFDTETTIDKFQNFKIGYFRICQDGNLQHDGLFYDPSMLDKTEIKNLKDYARKKKIEVYLKEEFIDDVFYPEIFELETLCTGFNLPFDISRLAYKYALSKGKNKGGFTFTLSKKPLNPSIVIKKLGDSYSFKFTSTIKNKGKKRFNGYFLDVQRLAEVLLETKHISLEKACEKLNTKSRKIADIEHGKVTPKYIEYLINDVKATHEVYEKLISELDIYQIDIPPTKIFSAASIGKHALSQLGITPFMEINPDFPDEMMGYIMSSYYGGRTECKIRKEPTKVTVLDFTSMYPTVAILMGLWDFIIADDLEIRDVTEEIKKLFSKIDLQYLQNKDNWKDFVVLVKIEPKDDILPVRTDYKGDKTALNVGVNHVTSNFGLWYALPDIIASFILTGKVPKIIEAKQFVPKGIQKGLKKSRIFDLDIDPSKVNFVQILVEKRQEIKSKLKTLDKDDPEHQHLSSRQRALKILVNAMSYGIFIELNPEDKKSDFQVYGLDDFNTSENRFEKPGNYFHPLLAVMITAGSRLFLAMAEAKLKALGSTHAYMDTDSIFVPPEYAQDIVDYYQPLNPYKIDIPLLKAEKEDIWFYGIASKRYALYNYENGNIWFMENERSCKLHGLGHLTNPFPNGIKDWHAEIWLDILKLHYGQITEQDIEEKYSNLYAISRLTVTTPNVLNRFKTINKDKEWKEQIKPFNFFNVGFQTIKENGIAVKPLAPFSKDSQKMVYEPFIDYQTGEIKQGVRYFKPLSKTILQYIDHPENKFNGDMGLLKRKHIHANEVVHIGKEANNIDEQALEVQGAQIFSNEEEIKKKILSLTPKKGREIGIKYRSTLLDLKKRVKKGELNFNTQEMRKILNHYSNI